MAEFEPEFTDLCLVCKNFVPVTEICPNIDKIVSGISGQICSQRVFSGEFCSKSLTTRFEPKDGVTEGEFEKYLTSDAFNSVTRRLPTERHIDHTLKVTFDWS